jgi:hypothetical protein
MYQVSDVSQLSPQEVLKDNAARRSSQCCTSFILDKSVLKDNAAPHSFSWTALHAIRLGRTVVFAINECMNCGVRVPTPPVPHWPR